MLFIQITQWSQFVVLVPLLVFIYFDLRQRIDALKK